MATFSLGQLKSIVRYHFGSNTYRGEENKKDQKKAQLLVEAKQPVEAHRGSAGGDGDGEEIMFAGFLVLDWRWGLGLDGHYVCSLMIWVVLRFT